MGSAGVSTAPLTRSQAGGRAVIVKASTSTFAQNCSNGDSTTPIDGGMYNVFCSLAK